MHNSSLGRQLPSFQMSISFSFFTSAFLLFFTSAFIADKNLTFFREKNETIFLISYVMMVWLSPLLWIDLSFLNRTGEEKKVKNPWVKIDCLLSLTTAIQHFYPFLNPLSLRCHHSGCWAIHALRQGCWSQLEPAGAVMGQPLWGEAIAAPALHRHQVQFTFLFLKTNNLNQTNLGSGKHICSSPPQFSVFK